MQTNFQAQLDTIIQNIDADGKRPTLLLHSCCAPCSSYVLEYLAQHFDITVFYYNPNIAPEEEYFFRAKEQEQLLLKMFPEDNAPKFLLGNYDTEQFYAQAKGFEQEPEGGERCLRCFHLRLGESAKLAKEGGFDFFTTTLTISPHKNAAALNQIGNELAKQFSVAFLPSDFKKKNGYRQSCLLSQEHGLYRQDYCGCAFSKAEMLARKNNP